MGSRQSASQHTHEIHAPMKAKAIRSIAAIVKWLSLITSFSALPVVELLPPQYSAYITFAFILTSTVKDSLISMGDAIDDGKRNNSFTVVIIGALMLLTFLPSCSVDAKGNKTFAGITRDGYLAGLKAGAVAAAPVLIKARQETAAKGPVEDLQP